MSKITKAQLMNMLLCNCMECQFFLRLFEMMDKKVQCVVASQFASDFAMDLPEDEYLIEFAQRMEDRATTEERSEHWN